MCCGGTRVVASLSSQTNSTNGLLTAKLFIPTASVLTLNTSPLTFVSAPGVGYAISVISSVIKSTYAGVAYATNTNLDLIINGAATFQQNFSINFSADKFGSYTNFSVNTNNHLENAALLAKIETGNPTLGTSNITLYIVYQIITL